MFTLGGDVACSVPESGESRNQGRLRRMGLVHACEAMGGGDFRLMTSAPFPV
jgi:hypothetical protein